jgi:hypothetical protein
MKTLMFTIIFLVIGSAPITFGYELILKSGKTVQGTLVTEDDEKITIKDEDGITLNFKKNLIDLQKTADANQPKPAESVVAVKEPEKPATKTEEPSKPKKPARVYEQSDVYRLRSEYPMESGAGVQFEEGKPDSAPKGRSGEEWQQITQSLLAQIKSAEQAYQQASAKCKEFQGATIQTHRAVTEEGATTDLVAAKEGICQAAEEAKSAVDNARAEYAAAVEQARQENVLPGYIATE